VLIALLIAALFLLPRAVFAGLVALLIVAAGLEWARLCRLQASRAWFYAVAVAAVFCLAVFFPRSDKPIFILAAAFWLAAVPAWLWRGLRERDARALAAAGFAVLVPAGLAMVSLRPLEVLLVLVLVWIADSAAYFVGRKWGRRKLAPAVSPGKTWEGAAGGVAGALGYAIICGFFLDGIHWVPYLAAAAGLAVISIAGDLFESAAKRQASVKDSGTLLPGHGGILDRIDSATAVLPLAALISPLIKGPL